MFYLITVALLIALACSYHWDNRSLLNPILLIFSLVSIYLSISYFFYSSGLTFAENLMYAAGFIVLPFIVFMSGLFLIYNGFILLSREGKSKANLLSLLLGIAILIFFALLFIRSRDIHGYTYLNSWLNLFFNISFFSYFLFGFAFAGFMIYSYLYLFIPKKKHYDFIIIHGAGLLNGETVTPLLKKRIDKAVEAYHKLGNPKTKLIASGGQGPDEKVSEAQAITHYLYQETKIPRENILLEDQSRTTYENLLFSKQLGETFTDQPSFLFVTNDYHVFRTSLYARSIQMKGDGLGCATATYYIPSAFIREFIAVCVKVKWLFILAYLLLFGVLVVSYHGILW